MFKTQFPKASELVYGCMGLGGDWNSNPINSSHIKQAHEVVETALDCGITVFDHADIYTLGKAEKVFSEVLRSQPQWRENMIIQSKCGIRFADEAGPKRYDFSSSWITQSIDGILQRLGIDHIDVLFLHRPDPLADLEELAGCLEQAHQAGKFTHLGVSNMHLYQIDSLSRFLPMPIIANQLEMSLHFRDWLEDGMTTNSAKNRSTGYTSGTLEYCQHNNIQLQAWGSLAQGKFTQANNANCQTTALVSQLAQHYNTSPEAIVLGWLTRHPSRIQPVIGTTNLSRIRHCCQPLSQPLSREHWYSLLESAWGQEVP